MEPYTCLLLDPPLSKTWSSAASPVGLVFGTVSQQEMAQFRMFFSD
jgi:hypothetical protein